MWYATNTQALGKRLPKHSKYSTATVYNCITY